MSVTDFDKIDMMGCTDGGKCFQMVISDHLDWEDEEIHLYILQEKINAYLAMIMDREWIEQKRKNAEYITIMIFFLRDITENCKKFLRAVQDQLQQYGIRIAITIADDDFRKKVKET